MKKLVIIIALLVLTSCTKLKDIKDKVKNCKDCHTVESFKKNCEGWKGEENGV